MNSGSTNAAPTNTAAPARDRVLAQARFETGTLMRNGEQLLVALVLPAMALVGLANSQAPSLGPGRRIDLAVPGVLALAVISTAFTGQAISTAFDRRYGVLRLLGVSPLGRDGLLVAKALAVLTIELLQFVVIAGLGLALGWDPQWMGLFAATLLALVGTWTFVALALLLAGTLRAEGVLALANLIWIALAGSRWCHRPAHGDAVRPLPCRRSPSLRRARGRTARGLHPRAADRNAAPGACCMGCGGDVAGITHLSLERLMARVTNPWLWRVLLVNLILEIGIVVTGGLVRLTGSGLGCPTWPQCVPGSFIPVPHQEQGFHKLIEFGNRTLTSVVGIAALLVIVAIWRWAPNRRPLRRISVLPLLGVLLQAVLGGITVLTGLNPALVAAHFLASMVLVSLSAYLLYRVGEGDDVPVALVRPEIRSVAWVTAGLGAVVLILGTVVTGSGPHSGDAATPRFGFDPRTISWLHADTVMLFAGLVVAVLLAVHLTASDPRPRKVWHAVLGVTVLQGLIGYAQYLTGLPEALVLVHMLGASLLTVSLTYGVLSLRRR